MFRFQNRGKFGSSRDDDDDSMKESLKLSFREHVQDPHAAHHRRLAKIEARRAKSKTANTTTITHQDQVRRSTSERRIITPRINKVQCSRREANRPPLADDCLLLVESFHASEGQYKNRLGPYAQGTYEARNTREPLSEINRNVISDDFQPRNCQHHLNNKSIQAAFVSSDLVLNNLWNNSCEEFSRNKVRKEYQEKSTQTSPSIEHRRFPSISDRDQLGRLNQFVPLTRFERHVKLKESPSPKKKIKSELRSNYYGGHTLDKQSNDEHFDSHPIKFVDHDLDAISLGASTLTNTFSLAPDAKFEIKSTELEQDKSMVYSGSDEAEPGASILSYSISLADTEKESSNGLIAKANSGAGDGFMQSESPSTTLILTKTETKEGDNSIPAVSPITNDFQDTGSVASTISYARSVTDGDGPRTHYLMGNHVVSPLLPELEGMGTEVSSLSYGYSFSVNDEFRNDDVVKRDVVKSEVPETPLSYSYSLTTMGRDANGFGQSESFKSYLEEHSRSWSIASHVVCEDTLPPTSSLTLAYLPSNDGKTTPNEGGFDKPRQANRIVSPVVSGFDGNHLRKSMKVVNLDSPSTLSSMNSPGPSRSKRNRFLLAACILPSIPTSPDLPRRKLCWNASNQNTEALHTLEASEDEELLDAASMMCSPKFTGNGRSRSRQGLPAKNKQKYADLLGSPSRGKKNVGRTPRTVCMPSTFHDSVFVCSKNTKGYF